MLATVSSAWSRFPRGVRAPGVAGLLIGMAGCQLVFGVDPNRDGGGDQGDARPSSCPTGMAEVTVTIDPVRMQNTVAGVTELVPDPIAPSDQVHELAVDGGPFTPVTLDTDGALRFCRAAADTPYRLRSQLGAGAPVTDLIGTWPAPRIGRLTFGRDEPAPVNTNAQLQVEIGAGPAQRTVLLMTTGVFAAASEVTASATATDVSRRWDGFAHLRGELLAARASAGDRILALEYVDAPTTPATRLLRAAGTSTTPFDLASAMVPAVVNVSLTPSTPAMLDVPFGTTEVAALRALLPVRAGRTADTGPPVAVRAWPEGTRAVQPSVLLGASQAGGMSTTTVTYAAPGILGAEWDAYLLLRVSNSKVYTHGGRTTLLSDLIDYFGVAEPSAGISLPPVALATLVGAPGAADDEPVLGFDPTQPPKVSMTWRSPPTPDTRLVVQLLEVVSSVTEAALALRPVYAFLTGGTAVTTLDLPVGVIARGHRYVLLAATRVGTQVFTDGDWVRIDYPFTQATTMSPVFVVP